MCRRNCFKVSVFLVSMLALSGMLFGQRVIDLDKVWGDMRVLGVDVVDQSGKALASGDINGDGYMDIIIGAYEADTIERIGAGETYVIFGSSNPPSTIDLNFQSADITAYGADPMDCCGYAVASGDINGDGYDDVIIGASWADPDGRIGAGETYVIFGSSFLSPPYTIDLKIQSPDISIYGCYVVDVLGSSLASGDVNGDGYDDIIMGASNGEDPERSLSGKTYAIFGSSNPPSIIDLANQSADITVYGADEGDLAGIPIASGDINGDGYDDLIIGAPRADPTGGYEAGETYVIFGSSFPTPPYTIDLYSQSADITVYGDDAEDRSGWAVARGDINGDEYDDVIIGAHFADPDGRYCAGKTYIIYGDIFSSPPYTIDLDTQSADITIYGDYNGDVLGGAVASGNVNGDGYSDIIIGSLGANPGGRRSAGKTYVIFGSSFSSQPYIIDLNSQPADITIYGDDDYDRCGSAVVSGDVNDDGYDDLIIGAPQATTPGGGSAGETYMILGGGTMITSHGLGGTSWIKSFSHLGRIWDSFKAFGVANYQGEVHLVVGDIDGDGLDEIVAGQGEGGDSIIKLFEVDGTLIRQFRAFGPPNSQGEVHLAIGNFDDDPSNKEIAAAHGEGGQSIVKLFKADGTFIRRFRVFGPPNVQGEVHLVAADLENNDGIDEIIAGMGEGSSSWVKIFSHDGTFIRKFKAFGPLNTQGEVHLAVGDVDGDGLYEIAAGQGYGGDSWVKLFEKDGTFIRTFKAFGAGNPNGEVHITAADMDNDGICEIICGHGEGGSSWVKVFKANGTLIRRFKAFGATNTQGEVHLAKSNY